MFRLRGRISSSGPNFVFRAEFRLRGRVSSSRPGSVFVAEFRLQGRISSSGPNFVLAVEFRLQGRISSSGPNFVFAAEFRLQSPISSSGPNFVFRIPFLNAEDFRLRAEFRLQDEFRLQRAPNRMSSSHEFCLQGRFSSSNFVFAHNLSFSSWRTTSSSKASEFRLQGGTKAGPSFPGQCIYATTPSGT